jgi:peptidoglycan hydrolase-like protein with peptidoglycan-binding domain
MTTMSITPRRSGRPAAPLWIVLIAALSMTAAFAVPAAAVSAAAPGLRATATAAAYPTIRYRARGAAVTYLQQRLTALAYDVGGVDGIFGPDTLHAVYAFRKVQAIAVDGVVVYLTRAGAVTRILDASPGKASTPTPTGDHTVYRRINGWRQSSLGLLWRPNYFRGGYAVHGSTSVPTYAASHGCVRVTVAAMNRVWSQLHIGERVHVYR